MVTKEQVKKLLSLSDDEGLAAMISDIIVNAKGIDIEDQTTDEVISDLMSLVQRSWEAGYEEAVQQSMQDNQEPAKPTEVTAK